MAYQIVRVRKRGGGYGKARIRMAAGPRGAARMRMYRRPRYNPVPTFTESFVGNPILFNQTSAGNSTGLIQNSMSAIAQFSQYAALYNQYCIRKVTAIFVPAYNVADTNVPTSATPVDAPRMVWAIQDSAQQTTPTVESDVLQDNGAKIRMFTKPVKVTWRPRAAVADALVAGGFVANTRRGAQWYTTTNPAVPHNGLAYSFTNAVPIAGTPTLASVYFKITFSLRDPK